MVIVIILALVALVIVGWFIVTYNMLIGLRVRTENAWSQIDVQLKRRYDLIPNLVEAVKGYMSHEKDTLERVIQARTQAINATGLKDKEQAENFLTQTLRSLFSVAERYPDLKADQHVLQLQEELTSTENRIAFARQYFNDEVQNLNTRIQTVPVNIVAAMARIEKKDFFQMADQAQKEPPPVRF